MRPLIDAVPHRAGEVGSWRDDAAVLAELRLATGGRSTCDGRGPAAVVREGRVIVADARIDNRAEIAGPLERLGFLARGAVEVSDAELILAAHRAWGDGAPARLIGDFAYAIWDRRRRRIIVARDPMGMRPLYYRHEPRRRILVASEIVQLLAVEGVPHTIDERAVACTLAGPYLPADATMYLGIEQLAPGHTFTADADGGRVRRHWRPDPGVMLHRSPADIERAYRDTLTRAVGDRLAGCAGLSLSGGLDSGSIASVAGKLQRGLAPSQRLRTYSWSFPTLTTSDERATSRVIADHYNLPNVPVEGDDAWPLVDDPRAEPDRDDPYVWPYQALIDRTLARAAADGVRVMLYGSRGDELVGDPVFDEVGLLASGRFVAAIHDLSEFARTDHRSPAFTLRRLVVLPMLQRWAPAVLRAWQARRGSALWPPWIPETFARRVALGDVIAEHGRLPNFDGYGRSVRYARIFSPQSARLSVLANRRASRYGVAVADPFADRRLIELVLSLPPWQVQRRAAPKRLAHDAVRSVMPSEAWEHVRKTIPVSLFERGMRERAVARVRDLVTNGQAAANGWLDEAELKLTYERYVATGQARHDFWWPLVVERWLRRWWS